ncbi:hypothetical protein F4703DRAFT_1566131 [Phycomyces blakesleeanus]
MLYSLQTLERYLSKSSLERYIYKTNWIQKFKKHVKHDILKKYSKDVDTIKFKDSKHTNTKIQQLIEIFPNVKNFSYASTGAYHYLVDVDLSRWKLLSRMTITWGLRNRLNILDNLFVLLSDLPSLVHLGIEPGYHTHPNRPITWRDIEKIHLGLPRLKSLKIRSDMDRIGPTEIGEIKQATPTNTMETVDYASMGFNLLWMQYLAIKYPKLKTLRLTVDQNTPLSIDVDNRPQRSELLMKN